ITKTFRVGLAMASGVDFGFSLALFGAGHLVGLSVGIAQLVGVLICWAWFVPMWTPDAFAHAAAGSSVDDVVNTVWHRVRYVGAGAIGVAAIWSLVKLIGPVVGGMIDTARASKNAPKGSEGGATGAYEDRDIPGVWIIGLSALSLVGV